MTKRFSHPILFSLCLCVPLVNLPRPLAAAEPADLIFHNGRVITVDANTTVTSALAVGGGKILAVGDDATVLKLRGPKTEVIDLDGKAVLPGLIDSHVHPGSASMHEFAHPIPDMESVEDVLDYVRARAKVVGPGKWVSMSQIFITRLKERRYPTRAELDAAAPYNPVSFSTGPDASVNSLALKISGIDKNFKSDDPAAKVEKDPATGEPTGILRSAGKYLKRDPVPLDMLPPEARDIKPTADTDRKPATAEDRQDRLAQLFSDYNSVGITGICDRNCGTDNMAAYQKLAGDGKLTVRIAMSRSVGNSGPVEKLTDAIRSIGREPLSRERGPMLRTVGIKCFLDGGMLTGSAYMRDPWGLSKIYSIDDPEYRGLKYIPDEKLVPMVRAAVESNLQFTAHSVGDGAVHALLAAYEEVNKSTPIAATRPCLTHSNFMSKEAVEQAARLGVVADIQPAWLWLDGETLSLQFGAKRLRYFQPLSSLFDAGVTVGGGSDHMQKIGSLRSINPYDPWLGMWIAQRRLPRGLTEPLHPEEALTRDQALRLYTANNARLMFLEDQIGTLEPGKLADLIVVDHDPLGCPLETLRDIKVLRTYLGGKLVFSR